MSTMEERVNGWFDQFTAAVEMAESAKESAGPLTSFGSAIGRFLKSLPTEGTEESYTLAEAIGEHLSGTITCVENLSALADIISKQTGSDRTEGDALSKSLTMAVESSLLEGEDRERAESLLARWSATGGKSSKGTSGSSNPAGKALPFPVKVTCAADGWSARQATTVNSLRWAAILHHEKEHGGIKPSKGDKVHQGLTEAINAVVDGKTVNAQGGGYLVDKTA